MSDHKSKLDIEVTNDMLSQTPVYEPRDWYPSSQAQELVRKFHEAFDEPIGHEPKSIGHIRGFLRVDLIKNGLEDFEKSINNDSLVGQYDALLEILLQTYGTLVEMGVDAGPGKREVMRSKMTMLNETFEHPNLFNVLTNQGWKPSYEDYLKQTGLKDPREVFQDFFGRKNIYEEVIQFVPEENPDEDTLVKIKRGVSYDGVTYFADEPHNFKKRVYQDFCVCGKIKVDAIHHTGTTVLIDWDIDNNEPRRKDNFRDRLMDGWIPPIEAKVMYERHLQELEYKYPTTRVVDGDLVFAIYNNGEKDIDWDFETNAPRVAKD